MSLNRLDPESNSRMISKVQRPPKISRERAIGQYCPYKSFFHLLLPTSVSSAESKLYKSSFCTNEFRSRTGCAAHLSSKRFISRMGSPMNAKYQTRVQADQRLNMDIERKPTTAKVNGQLWGARARDWAEIQERVLPPRFSRSPEACRSRRYNPLFGCGLWFWNGRRFGGRPWRRSFRH